MELYLTAQRPSSPSLMSLRSNFAPGNRLHPLLPCPASQMDELRLRQQHDLSPRIVIKTSVHGFVKGFVLTQWMDLEWRCKCGLITITPSQKQAVGLGLQVERELPGATWLSGGLAEAPPSWTRPFPPL